MDTEKIEFPGEIEKAKLSELRFMLNEVQEKNKSLNEISDILYQRSALFFGISITAISSLIVFIADNKPAFVPKYIICWEIIIMLVWSCFIIKRNLKMSGYHGVGTVPKVFTDEYFYPKGKGHRSLGWRLTKKMILDHHERIQNNRRLNEDRASRLQKAIEVLYYIPGVIIVSGILVYCLNLTCF